MRTTLALESLAKTIAIAATLADVIRAGLAPEPALPRTADDGPGAPGSIERARFLASFCEVGAPPPPELRELELLSLLANADVELGLLRSLAEAVSEHFLAGHMLDNSAYTTTHGRAVELLQRWRRLPGRPT